MHTGRVLCCLLGIGSSLAFAGDFAFVAPGPGKVLAHASILERRDDHLARVQFRDEQGTELLTLRFLQRGPGEVTFQPYAAEGLPTPTIFVASSYARADGENVDLVAVGAVDGRLRKLFSFSDRDLSDAVCISPSKAGSPANVVLARFLDGDYCFLCWPKRFEVTTYLWEDATLRPVASRRTAQLHPDWSSALGELQVPCGKEVLESTAVPDKAAEQTHAPGERAVSEQARVRR